MHSQHCAYWNGQPCDCAPAAPPRPNCTHCGGTYHGPATECSSPGYVFCEPAAPPACPNCARLERELSGCQNDIQAHHGALLRIQEQLTQERDAALAEVERLKKWARKEVEEYELACGILVRRYREVLEWYANPCAQCEEMFQRSCHGSSERARTALAAQAPGDVPDAPPNRDKPAPDVTPVQVEPVTTQDLIREFHRYNFKHVNDTEWPWGTLTESYCDAVVQVCEKVEALEAVAKAANRITHQSSALHAALANLKRSGWRSG